MKNAKYELAAISSMLACFALVGILLHEPLYNELAGNLTKHLRQIGLLLILVSFGVLGYAAYPQTRVGVLRPEVRRKQILKRISVFFPLAAAGILLYAHEQISF